MKIKIVIIALFISVIGRGQQPIDTNYFRFDAEDNLYYSRKKVNVSELTTNRSGIFKAIENSGFSFKKGTDFTLGEKKFIRFDQHYNNVRIKGNSYYITVNLEDEIESIGGKAFTGSALNVDDVRTKQQAIDNLMSKLGNYKYKWEDATLEENLKQAEEDADATYYPKPELTIQTKSEDVENVESYVPVYKIIISALKTVEDSIYADTTYYVNATNGNILSRVGPQCLHAPAKPKTGPVVPGPEAKNPESELKSGSCNNSCNPGGVTVHYYGGQQINTSEFTYAGFCTNRLKNNCTGTTLYTREYSNSFGLSDIMSNNNSWPNQSDKVGITAHWCLEKTYEAFKNILGLNSYDNAYSQVNIELHTSYGSQWSPNQKIYISKFQNSASWEVTLDIVGHEFGHAVMEHTSDLGGSVDYTSINTINSSYLEAAMKEGFADVFGQMVEFYVSNNYSTLSPHINDFISGGDRPGGPQSTHERSMINPSSLGNPDVVDGANYHGLLTTSDPPTEGDVLSHQNSTIIGKWYYFLSMGGSGTNGSPWNNPYCVTGIGQEKAAKISYLAACFNINNFSRDFEGMRLATIQAANTLFGAGSNEAAQVGAAWFAVGIGTSALAGVPFIFVGNKTDVGTETYHYNNEIRHQDYIVTGGANIDVTSGIEINILSGTDIGGANYDGTIASACSGSGARFAPVSSFQGEEININDNVAADVKINNTKTNIEFKVIPNPTTGNVKIVLDNAGQYPSSITIVNVLGNAVYENKKPDAYEISLDISNAAPGVYIVKIIYDGKVLTKKIIKN